MTTPVLTYEHIRDIIPEDLTPVGVSAINNYLADGIVPPADPCISCEPNLLRSYISRIQRVERTTGLPKPLEILDISPAGGILIASEDDPNVSFPEVFAEAEEEPKPKPKRTSKPKAK